MTQGEKSKDEEREVHTGNEVPLGIARKRANDPTGPQPHDRGVVGFGKGDLADLRLATISSGERDARNESFDWIGARKSKST